MNDAVKGSATPTSEPGQQPRTGRPRHRHLIIALVGNPNTGKTTLFNSLSGLRQHVGNYPGVTVEKKVGRTTHAGWTLDLVDLPGTYSLAARSPDEMVTVNLLLGCQPGEPRPDAVISIVDASNLERNLYLTTQLLEMGVPVVIALNMIDVAENKGRKVRTELLEKRLGVPVVAIQANRGRGLAALKDAVIAAAEKHAPSAGPTFPTAFDNEVSDLQRQVQHIARPSGRATVSWHSPFITRRLLLDAGGYTERVFLEQYGPGLAESLLSARSRLASAGCPVPAVEPRTRYGWIRQALDGCIEQAAAKKTTWSDSIDHVLTHRVWGTLIFLLVMFLVFQSIFTLAAPLMDYIVEGQAMLGTVVGDAISPGPLRSLLVSGVIKGVGSVLVFLPQILILFGFIAILEDCGYMARAAFLMDKIMYRCGLSGKSFIPLLSSFACAIPGIMATRVIENRRDRLATILVAPLMSCSARLPVYTLMIEAFIPQDTALGLWLPGLVLFGLYLLGIVLAPVIALLLKRTLLRGEPPIFLMELPPYKWPSLRTILFRMYDRGMAFVRRAGTLILASMIVVWALLYFPYNGIDAEGNSINYDAVTASLEEEISARQQVLEPLEEQLKELEAAAPPAGQESALRDEREKLEAAIAAEKAALDPLQQSLNSLLMTWRRQSVLGRVGMAIEPVVEPLGWDWRIGMAALASFPAREVVVATLGIIYEAGPEQDEESDELREQLQQATWGEGSTRAGQPLFTLPAALSLLVFFALCCQCASTLVVIKRETNSWGWPVFVFVYMTALAYVGALITYQVGRLFL